jgi:hypothetical protein
MVVATYMTDFEEGPLTKVATSGLFGCTLDVFNLHDDLCSSQCFFCNLNRVKILFLDSVENRNKPGR